MKASELRIGNYISYHGIHIAVNGIIGSTIFYEGGKYFDSNTMGYEPYQPIPVTEEWLLRFGFKKTEDTLFGMDEFRMHGYSFALSNLSLENGFGIINEHPTKYVHQLQNLYFALTGEELTYKETE